MKSRSSKSRCSRPCLCIHAAARRLWDHLEPFRGKKSRLLHAQSRGQTLLSRPCRSLIRASSASPAAPQLPRNVAKLCSSHLRSQTDVTTRSCHTEARANLHCVQSTHTAPTSLGCPCRGSPLPSGAALCSKAVPVSLTHTWVTMGPCLTANVHIKQYFPFQEAHSVCLEAKWSSPSSVQHAAA